MSIIRWGPETERPEILRSAVERMFGDPVFRPLRLWDAAPAVPAIDMYETDASVVVKASLPGVDPEEAEITITGDTLTIRAETRAEPELKSENCYHQERRYGKLSRVVSLPGSLQTAKAEAAFEHGVVTVTIPKAEEAKPRLIKIKAAAPVEAKKKP
jgi:HSP20 family protein